MLNPTDDHRPAASRARVLWRLGAVSVAAAALLVACGDDDGTTTTIAPAVPATVTPATTVAATTPGNAYGY